MTHNGAVVVPHDVEVPPHSLERLGRLIGPARRDALMDAGLATLRALGGARVWNISSTAAGGGVAELVRLLSGYALDAGIETHWVVLDGDPAFFAITKRLHNRLHGAAGDTGALSRQEASHYDAVLDANLDALAPRIAPGDVVVLHDPQTAGLASRLVAGEARVVWRCHVGAEVANEHTEEAWAFLRPHLAACHTFVFSLASYVPSFLADQDVWVIEPSIDPCSEKNRPLRATRVAALLAQLGLVGDPTGGSGSTSAIVGGAPPFSPDDQMVVQVSRWDHLKDMVGVLRGFAEHVAGRDEVRLALVGPAVEGVADDPEGQRVLAECIDEWTSLAPTVRNAIRLVVLPMSDGLVNARAVNAIQRHASVVVQKSLHEGYGLTVSEAMWKQRAVLASAVGGITAQIPPGTGVLLDDPADLDAFGRSLARLVDDPPTRRSLGRRARRHVRAHGLSDRHLIRYGELLRHMTSR